MKTTFVLSALVVVSIVLSLCGCSTEPPSPFNEEYLTTIETFLASPLPEVTLQNVDAAMNDWVDASVAIDLTWEAGQYGKFTPRVDLKAAGAKADTLGVRIARARYEEYRRQLRQTSVRDTKANLECAALCDAIQHMLFESRARAASIGMTEDPLALLQRHLKNVVTQARKEPGGYDHLYLVNRYQNIGFYLSRYGRYGSFSADSIGITADEAMIFSEMFGRYN